MSEEPKVTTPLPHPSRRLVVAGVAGSDPAEATSGPITVQVSVANKSVRSARRVPLRADGERPRRTERMTVVDTSMVRTMRWFGPGDAVSLSSIRQAGATEVVTALHEVANGEVWRPDAIRARKAMVEAAGLGWTVVESLPVHEGIKTCGPDWERLVVNYADSLRNLAACGIEVVTYNFMPLLDWTRTDLAWELPDGARALRFEWEAVAAYDLHILRRPGAEADYDGAVRTAAANRFGAMDETARAALERTILAGLPGAAEHFTSARFLEALATYANIDADALRASHHAFVAAVAPIAAEVGIRLVVHPDDPPFPLFGLPAW